MHKLPTWLLIIIVIVFLGGVIQLIPYGHTHANPPITGEPQWNNSAIRELTKRTCFDCHSNETNWRWYTNIAPSSWLVARDVEEGRDRLNFSEWDKPGSQKDFDEIEEVIQEGEMPPFQYLLLHPEARLTAVEKQDLIQALHASLAK